MAQSVKNSPAMQETQVGSLGGEDPLKKEMATHSNILAMNRGAWRATVHEIPKQSDLIKRLKNCSRQLIIICSMDDGRKGR